MENHPYKHISVLVMPTDYCNMNCVYCFNYRREHEKRKVIDLATLEQVFRVTIPFYEEIRFIWHGGEPLSMGVDFYRQAVALQKKYNTHGAKVENSVQTNLTLMDRELAAFFVENKFNVGSSFDGTRNHLTRHNSDKIMAGRDLMLEQGDTVGFICVVQRQNIDHLIEDYEWFKSKKINYSLNQYLTAPPYEKDPLFVPEEQYVARMCELFDHWGMDTGCNIRISTFDHILAYLLEGKKQLCSYNSCLGKHVGIHYDGTIYNCNRDFAPDCAYGNVHDYTDIRQCFRSSGFENMAKNAVRRRYLCKEKCPIFDFCAGGCNSCAYTGGDLSRPNEYVCRTLIGFYRHVEKRLGEWKKLPPEQLNPTLATLLAPKK